MRFECRLLAEPASVPRARRFVTEALAGLNADTMFQVELLVSELATNCVIHAGTDFHIALTVTGRALRIDVTDDGRGKPQVRTPAPTDPHGRGLRLVDRIATAWGIHGSNGFTGKTLWFSMLVPDTTRTAPTNRKSA